MTEGAAATDMSFGLSMVFVLVAVVAAAGMYATHDEQILAASSFAIAVGAGVFAVLAAHLYD